MLDHRTLSSLTRALTAALALAAVATGAARAQQAGWAEKLAAWERHRALGEASLFQGIEWRSVGPVLQGGRVVDVETVPGEPYTFYVAYASGGLWKTTNNGLSFEPVFDDQPTLIMGDIAVAPSRPRTVWAGTGENNSSRSSYGGLGMFRSDDGGATWQQAGLEESDRIGRILVDPTNPDRVWVAVLGRLYTSGGERGIYRTSDGGTTWEQVLVGGETTGFIDLVLDPSAPDTLYAAAWDRLRRPWDFREGGAGSGVWKSTDGGDSWRRLAGGFPAGEHIGRIGLTLCAGQPRTLYAVVDHQEALPEELWDLGDGAVTPKRLRTMTREEFLEQDPEEIEDFIRGNDLATDLDAAKLIELVKSGEVTIRDLLDELDDANANLFETDIRGLEVWRSDDAGETWRRTHDQPVREVVYTYGYYFGQIRVSPTDPERIWVLGVPAVTSGDGGRTFESMQDPDVHVDYHAMWVDPSWPDRFFVGSDGGLNVTFDGGKSFLRLDAQPVGQFYAITLDMAEPYNIYGGLQDNGSMAGSSRTRWELGERWRYIGGGDGMQVQVDPRDSATIYAGFQFGFYQRTDPDGSRREVRPRDALKSEEALRYNWQTPILLSSHNADILYFGTQRLMRSFDKGETWTAISPDLTRSPMRGDVPFATITTIAESPLEFGLLWAGTDDGLVWVSDNAGRAWTEVTEGLPSARWVSRVEASRHHRDRAWVTLNGYRDDEITAYLFRTDDLGRTWTSLAGGLPAEPVNVVREDPVNENVLYVGTDRGVYVSLDGGAAWQGIGSGLPPVPVHDLAIHPRDRELVAGTHGRSAWVLDVLPVQDLTPELLGQGAHVFPIDSVTYERDWRSQRSLWFDRPEYRPEAKISLFSGAAGAALLEITDADGRVLRRLEQEGGRGVSVVTWDLLLDEEMALVAEHERLAKEDREAAEAAKTKTVDTQGKGDGTAATDETKTGARARTPWAELVRLGRPLYVTPGTYTVKLTAAGASAEAELVVEAPEPRRPRARKEPAIRGRKDDDGKRP